MNSQAPAHLSSGINRNPSGVVGGIAPPERMGSNITRPGVPVSQLIAALMAQPKSTLHAIAKHSPNFLPPGALGPNDIPYDSGPAVDIPDVSSKEFLWAPPILPSQSKELHRSRGIDHYTISVSSSNPSVQSNNSHFTVRTCRSSNGASTTRDSTNRASTNRRSRESSRFVSHSSRAPSSSARYRRSSSTRVRKAPHRSDSVEKLKKGIRKQVKPITFDSSMLVNALDTSGPSRHSSYRPFTEDQGRRLTESTATMHREHDFMPEIGPRDAFHSHDTKTMGRMMPPQYHPRYRDQHRVAPPSDHQQRDRGLGTKDNIADSIKTDRTPAPFPCHSSDSNPDNLDSSRMKLQSSAFGPGWSRTDPRMDVQATSVPGYYPSRHGATTVYPTSGHSGYGSSISLLNPYESASRHPSRTRNVPSNYIQPNLEYLIDRAEDRTPHRERRRHTRMSDIGIPDWDTYEDLQKQFDGLYRNQILLHGLLTRLYDEVIPGVCIEPLVPMDIHRGTVRRSTPIPPDLTEPVLYPGNSAKGMKEMPFRDSLHSSLAMMDHHHMHSHRVSQPMSTDPLMESLRATAGYPNPHQTPSSVPLHSPRSIPVPPSSSTWTGGRPSAPNSVSGHGDEQLGEYEKTRREIAALEAFENNKVVIHVKTDHFDEHQVKDEMNRRCHGITDHIVDVHVYGKSKTLILLYTDARAAQNASQTLQAHLRRVAHDKHPPSEVIKSVGISKPPIIRDLRAYSQRIKETYSHLPIVVYAEMPVLGKVFPEGRKALHSIRLDWGADAKLSTPSGSTDITEFKREHSVVVFLSKEYGGVFEIKLSEFGERRIEERLKEAGQWPTDHR